MRTSHVDRFSTDFDGDLSTPWKRPQGIDQSIADSPEMKIWRITRYVQLQPPERAIITAKSGDSSNHQAGTDGPACNHTVYGDSVGTVSCGDFYEICIAEPVHCLDEFPPGYSGIF